jgi:peptidoglycan/LPS O-acetylase OafA/YrhL
LTRHDGGTSTVIGGIATASAGVAGPRLRRIDALRGIAALLVVWLHVAESYVGLGPIDGRWMYEFARSIDVGRVGVVAFFLISGFVIPFSIRIDSPAPVGSFLL